MSKKNEKEKKKKKKEKQALKNAFLSHPKLGKIKWGPSESPDFHAKIEKKHIGIELVRYVHPKAQNTNEENGNKRLLIAKEGYIEKMKAKVEALLKKSEEFSSVSLKIELIPSEWNLNSGCEIPKKIVNFLKENISTAQFFPKEKLPRTFIDCGIKKIEVCFNKEDENKVYIKQLDELSMKLDLRYLKETIEKKNILLRKNYKGKFDEIWLLIYSELSFSSLLKGPIEPDELAQLGSKFDRTFYSFIIHPLIEVELRCCTDMSCSG